MEGKVEEGKRMEGREELGKGGVIWMWMRDKYG